jgi:GTP pyrophosphokinase
VKPVELVAEAAALAAQAHAPQRRKIGGEPYVNHVIRVARDAARLGLPPEAVAAALLHDVVEDTPVTLAELRERFPARVVRLVELLTQTWPDDAPAAVKAARKPPYYAALLTDPEAALLKLLDRADNLADTARVVERAPKWAVRYLRRSEAEMAPVLAACGHDGVRARYAEAHAALAAAVARL